MKHTLIITLAIIAGLHLSAQTPDWNTGGNSGIDPSNGDMLGTTDNTPIPFRTDNTERMRLWPSNVVTIGVGSNAYTIDQGGFLGIGLDGNFFTGTNATGPYSLLHLNGDNTWAPQQTGYRDWMKYGISYTHNQDFMYVGPRQVNGEYDYSRAVIAWSDNDGQTFGPDDFSFIFTDNDNNASGDYEGQELMRITGSGYVGIGNFQPNGLNQQPTERLDVDGTARLRQMTTGNPDVLITGIQADGVGDYILHYLPVSQIPFDDYDWGFTPNQGVFTGFVDPGTCNEWNVGMGAHPQADSKVYVFNDNDLPNAVKIRNFADVNTLSAVRINSTQLGNGIHFGVNSIVSDGSVVIAGRFQSSTSTGSQSVGVVGTAGGASVNNIGLYGFAEGSDCMNPEIAIGVYGEASPDNNPTCAANYAGYFAGTVVSTQDPIGVSDETLKQEIQDLTGAMDVIQALRPTKYELRTDEYGFMNLDQDVNYGFIAQELQEVLPEIVEDIAFPAKLDSTGVELSPRVDLKGIRYRQLIPILTQGIKEQQAEIDILNDRLGQMEAMMLDMGMDKHNSDARSNAALQKDFELYQNRPNPFAHSTEIVWNMAHAADCRILVHDGQGRLLEILKQGQQAEGLHSLIWDASQLQDGTYYYSLEVEGELLIKKAIKVQH